MGSKFKLVGVVGIALLLVLATGTAFAQNTLRGDQGQGVEVALPSIGATQELLQVGDFGSEFGIGCSNGAGTSGGPNELALGVTATSVIPPFNLTTFSYDMFTNISPNMTQLSFVAWAGGGSPGATVDVAGGLPFGQGVNLSINLAGVTVNSSAFYLGVVNPQTNVGFRIGVDSSSGSQGSSYIRAAGCGASAFTLLDQIGFAGNWVMRAVANGVIPVELETFEIE